MEENQLILSFRQLIKLIIGSDKDIINRIDLESNKWKASSDEIFSKISDEEKFRSEADLNLEEKIMYNLSDGFESEAAARKEDIANLEDLQERIEKLEKE